MTAPSAVASSMTGATRRGPKRSSATPAGSWATTKAARYIEVTTPMAASSRPSSLRSAGATTAFSERNRKLRK